MRRPRSRPHSGHITRGADGVGAGNRPGRVGRQDHLPIKGLSSHLDIAMEFGCRHRMPAGEFASRGSDLVEALPLATQQGRVHATAQRRVDTGPGIEGVQPAVHPDLETTRAGHRLSPAVDAGRVCH
ncbi:MAG: hypothetical protein ACK55Z_11095, partial [bacterium]